MLWYDLINGVAQGGVGGRVPPHPKSWQKLSKKNGIKLVEYNFRLKNSIKFLSNFSELVLPMDLI